MKKEQVKNILIIALVAIAVFGLTMYLVTLKEKRRLLGTLDQLQAQVTSLEEKEQKLMAELKREKDRGASLSKEIKDLKAWRSSIVELKKAIRELQREMHRVAFQIKQKTSDYQDRKEYYYSGSQVAERVYYVKQWQIHGNFP